MHAVCEGHSKMGLLLVGDRPHFDHHHPHQKFLKGEIHCLSYMDLEFTPICLHIIKKYQGNKTKKRNGYTNHKNIGTGKTMMTNEPRMPPTNCQRYRPDGTTNTTMTQPQDNMYYQSICLHKVVQGAKETKDNDETRAYLRQAQIYHIIHGGTQY
jgi:hypothetical protein